MFAVIGEALLDLVQSRPGGPFEAQPGGGPLNIAVGLRRLGHPTEMVARLSSGSLGSLVRDHIQAHDLGMSWSVDTEAPTTLAFVALDGTGQAAYEFYVAGTADWQWTASELAELPPGTRVAHTGSLAAAVTPGADTLLGCWQRERAEGQVLLSFDPNIRPVLMGEHDEAVRRVEAFVASSHVVKASEEDAAWLYGSASLQRVAARWGALGPDLVVFTKGPHGCLAVTSAGEMAQRPGRRVEVVDTIGAGDAFCAGLLSGLADGGCASPDEVSRIPADVLTSALERAVIVSALTCARRGADPPTRDEVDAEVSAA